MEILAVVQPQHQRVLPPTTYQVIILIRIVMGL